MNITDRKNNQARRIAICIVISLLLLAASSLAISRGKYFKNMITSFSLLDAVLLTAVWVLLFALFAIVLYVLLSNSLSKRICVCLYVIQFICYLFCLIARYCFGAYAISMVSCFAATILTTALTVKLLKIKQYLLFVILCFYLVILMCCLFNCIMFYSLQYGQWKD